MKGFEDIVEVVHCPVAAGANNYLAHGYRLLHIDSTSYSRNDADGKLLLLRRLSFVLGRTADVESWREPSREERLAKSGEVS